MRDQHKHFYQVVSQNCTERQGTVTIGLKVVKTIFSKIYFGLAINYRRVYQYSAMHKGVIAYKLSGGKFLYEDGQNSTEKIPAVQEKETIWISVNNTTK